MRLSSINTENFSNSFKARRLSQVSVKLPTREVNYNVYRLTEKDDKFLKTLKSEINLEERWSKLGEKDYEDWNFILKKALSFFAPSYGYLITHDKKPCGVLNARKVFNDCDVHWVTTWPLEKDKKMPFAGKVLFLQLFKELLEQNDVKQVKLTSIKGDAFGAFAKYRELKFEPYGGNGHCELMKIKFGNLSDAINKFKSSIEFIPQNQEEVDLAEELNIDKQ